jgi:hypothetical protein
MSVIYRMRLRLLEEGIIDVVSSYILPYADGPMRYVRMQQQKMRHCSTDRSIDQSITVITSSSTPRYNVAVTLHNIACNRSCRSEMVNRGVVACLLALSAPPPVSTPPTQDPPTATDAAEAGKADAGAAAAQQAEEHARLLECVAVTLQCLSFNVSTRRRTIQEGAVRIVLNLLEQRPAACGPRALQACAQALHAFSAFDDCAAPLLRHQAVPALVKLSETAEPLLAARESVVAGFCNLLSLEGNHAVMLDQVRWRKG